MPSRPDNAAHESGGGKNGHDLAARSRQRQKFASGRNGRLGGPESSAGGGLRARRRRSRLVRQSEELRCEAEALLARVGLRSGQAAIDVGCGPAGIIDLLADAVAPGGRVTGLDANPAHVAMAQEHARARGLAGVELMLGDARDTGLPSGSFDLVHARTLLVTVPQPAEVLAEMVRLAKPGGWVAGQEPDCEHALCYPPLPAWDRLRELFFASFGRPGADPLIGRRLTELYRDAGLVDVEVLADAGNLHSAAGRRAGARCLGRENAAGRCGVARASFRRSKAPSLNRLWRCLRTGR